MEPNYALCWHKANQASYYFGAVPPPAHKFLNEIKHPDAKVWFKLTVVKFRTKNYIVKSTSARTNRFQKMHSKLSGIIVQKKQY